MSMKAIGRTCAALTIALFSVWNPGVANAATTEVASSLVITPSFSTNCVVILDFTQTLTTKTWRLQNVCPLGNFKIILGHHADIDCTTLDAYQVLTVKVSAIATLDDIRRC